MLFRSIKSFTEAIKIKPEFAEAYNDRGFTRCQNGDIDGGIEDYTEAIRIKPNFAIAYFNRGNANYSSIYKFEAIKDYSAAIRIKPDFAEAHNDRGILFNHLGESDQAIEDFDKAIQINPNYSEAYNNRGNVYKNQGKFDDAIADYCEGIRLKPDNSVAYFNRGITRYKIGDLNGAFEDFRKYLNMGGGSHYGNQVLVEGFIRGLKMVDKVNLQIKKDFFLPELDNDEDDSNPTTITVRKASQVDEISRNNLLADYQRIFQGTYKVYCELGMVDDIRRHEVFLTLAACNFVDGDNGKFLFNFKDYRIVDHGAFDRAWAKLQRHVGNLIYRKVLEVNPQWGSEDESATVEDRKVALTLELAPGITMDFMRVPAGEFLMGSDPDKDEWADDAEQPQHKVYLDEYLIGRYPVTNKQYRAFMDACGDYCPSHWNNGEFPEGEQDHPVNSIPWHYAAAFCIWASDVSGQKVRLPTEAEWEKAARGMDGRLYPWGDQIPDESRCNFNNNGGNTSPVGLYSPIGDGPYGCADQAGNVWEWVEDWYRYTYYESSPVSNPTGPTSGKNRILRGGSFNESDEHRLRVSNRQGIDPVSWYGDDGFRCAI